MNERRTVLSASIYKTLERCVSLGITFFVSIVLARIVPNEDYGVIVIVLTFTKIAQIVVQSGLNTALIQKKEPVISDYNTVFSISLIIASIIYCFLFFLAPLVESFYSISGLGSVLRVISLILFPNSFNAIQYAMISKRLDFKKNLFSSLGGAVVSGLTSIILAYRGLGVWALVSQQLLNQVVVCIILQMQLKWHPRLEIIKTSAKELFSFGWKLMAASLVNKIGEDFSNLIIGKKYSPEALAYYSNGKQYPQYAMTVINDSVRALILPLVSEKQDSPADVKLVMKKSIKASVYVVFPIMLGLLVCADEVISIFLTDKWIDSVPFFRLFCAFFLLHPIHVINLQTVSGIGKSNYFLRLEMIKKSVLVACIVIVTLLNVSVMAYAIVELSLGILSLYVNSYYSKKLIGYSLLEQIIDILPSLICSIIMVLAVSLISILQLNIYCSLILKMLVGVITYIFLSFVFKIEAQKYILDKVRILKRTLKKGK